jgi:hypothetical protein
MNCCGRQLGSASLDLIQRSSETLAGRIAFIELSGLHRLEVPSGLWDNSKVTRFISTPCSLYNTPASSASVVPVGTKRPPDENHSVLQNWIDSA